ELSNSRESPGLSCNSSRTGLGSTSRPVLSSVRVVTINAILPYHLPFRMLSELRSSIPSGSHADADGRYLTAQRLCSTITSTSHYILRRGFHAGRGRSAIRSASHIRSQYRKMDLAVGRNCLCCGIAFFDLQPAGAARAGEQRSSREQSTNCRADQTHPGGCGHGRNSGPAGWDYEEGTRLPPGGDQAPQAPPGGPPRRPTEDAEQACS